MRSMFLLMVILLMLVRFFFGVHLIPLVLIYLTITNFLFVTL